MDILSIADFAAVYASEMKGGSVKCAAKALPLVQAWCTEKGLSLPPDKLPRVNVCFLAVHRKLGKNFTQQVFTLVVSYMRYLMQKGE